MPNTKVNLLKKSIEKNSIANRILKMEPLIGGGLFAIILIIGFVTPI